MMATISVCACYSDWAGKVSFFNDGIIYLTLDCKEKDLSYSFSINPAQAKVLGEILANASLLPKIDEEKAMLFGDLTMALDVEALAEKEKEEAENKEKEEETENKEEEELGMDCIRIDEEYIPEIYRPLEKVA